MLEHIETQELLCITIGEFHRVLECGGLLEIVVPDFEKAIIKWVNGDEPYRWGFGLTTIFGNQKHPGQYHYTGFSKQRLRKLISTYGFDIIRIENQDNRHKRDRRFIPKGDISLGAVKI